MTTCLPEVTEGGLVLWHLQRGANDSLICSVLGYRRDPVLAVYDPTTPRVLRAEVHTDIVSLVQQADAIRDALLSDGWQEIDALTEEPLGQTRR